MTLCFIWLRNSLMQPSTFVVYHISFEFVKKKSVWSLVEGLAKVKVYHAYVKAFVRGLGNIIYHLKKQERPVLNPCCCLAKGLLFSKWSKSLSLTIPCFISSNGTDDRQIGLNMLGCSCDALLCIGLLKYCLPAEILKILANGALMVTSVFESTIFVIDCDIWELCA